MDSGSTEELIAEIREYLESCSQARENQPSEPRQVDLYALLSEFIALRTEVKIESRQFKSALERFTDGLQCLAEEKSHLTQRLEQCIQQRELEKRAVQRTLLMEILDLYDRIAAGAKAAESYKPPAFSLFSKKRERAVIRGMRDGQALTLNRIDQLLVSHDVRAIEVIGRQLDPETMHATEVEYNANLKNGMVTGELRRGFRWNDEILRAAEVTVNRVE